jgi:hypothetical protein
MAEIRVEKKSPMWPWILIALLVIGAIIYFLFFHDANGVREDPGEAPVVREMTDDDDRRGRDGEAINNQTVNNYVTFVQEEDREMGLDHEYSNEALRRLTEATQAMADEVNHDVDRDLEEVRNYAEEITRDPEATTHANHIRRSADKLSDALRSIQQAEFPNLGNEASNVRNAAQNINPEVLTLEQRNEVKSFFDSAADLLQKMNN